MDLTGSPCRDADLRRLLPRLKYFTKVGQLSLNNTEVTDAGLDAIGKTFQETQSLSRIDVTGSKVTKSGIAKLKRTPEWS